MANMKEAIRSLYSGQLSRQLVLFSICGVVGLYNAYLSFDVQGMASVQEYHKYLYMLIWLFFAYFLIGYEVIFLHERKLPEADTRSFKIMANKVLGLVFLLSIPFLIMSLFYPQYTQLFFVLEIILSVPLTMLQAGYSYNFDKNDFLKLFKNFGIKEYFYLIIKRLWLIFCAYLFSFSAVFLIFFIFGLVFAFIYRGDLSSMILSLSSIQLPIIKLSNFIAGVLLIYSLTIATLVWDYELIKTFEKKEEA